MQPITRDSLPFIAGMVRQLVITTLTTCVARFMAGWWKIKLGRCVRFNGLPIFRRLPKSSITVGDACVFTSSSRYNLIGVNHPAILATLSHEAVITIGHHCGFSGTTIGCMKRITIGNHVRCGSNTVITDTDWHRDDPRTTPDEEVFIQDNVWLGLNVTVLKGVTIGENSIIATGSIVTRSIPPNVIAAGVPAKVIRELPPKSIT
jgi:acetyltransferase-like isoleucine patch superfamily enzyme